jgi:hypothetical protein
MLEKTKAAVPPFVRVAVCVPLVVPMGWFPKERLPGETLLAGAVAGTPVPLRLTFFRPPPALVMMLRVANL